MDIKTQRIAEAQRLNALDDLKAHVEGITDDVDKQDVQAILLSVEADKPREANEQYWHLDTFVREGIPETFDDWLRTTVWSQDNA